MQTWLNVLMAVNKGRSFLLNSLILDLDSNDSHLQKEAKYFNRINRNKLSTSGIAFYFHETGLIPSKTRICYLHSKPACAGVSGEQHAHPF
ncbi:hypothetical protein [Janthinobacterium lividum]|uniref:hypothetical protein n=1 Tax=Janthinobacterium lividum TaxID=29581 RepID=UPI001C31628E|nr:hypothetical protein [Janthinobacterium lividum]